MVDVVGAIIELHRSPEHVTMVTDFEVTVAISFASSRDTLGETLNSLANQVDAPIFELLLVSNATFDDSVAVAKSAACGMAFRIVECDSAGYDANARNVSIKEASAAKILFLDADDTISSGYVSAMSKALDSSPLVTGIWAIAELNAQRFPELQGRSGSGTDLVDLPFRHQGWTYAPAGSMGMRREVPTAIGGFRTDLDHGANNEWCFRAYAAGFPTVAVPAAIVHYRLRSRMWDNIRQRYRWGSGGVVAQKVAREYGMPRMSLLRAVGGATAFRLACSLIRMRTRLDVYNFAGLLATAAGSVVGSIRYRHLAL